MNPKHFVCPIIILSLFLCLALTCCDGFLIKSKNSGKCIQINNQGTLKYGVVGADCVAGALNQNFALNENGNLVANLGTASDPKPFCLNQVNQAGGEYVKSTRNCNAMASRMWMRNDASLLWVNQGSMNCIYYDPADPKFVKVENCTAMDKVYEEFTKM